MIYNSSDVEGVLDSEVLHFSDVNSWKQQSNWGLIVALEVEFFFCHDRLSWIRVTENGRSISRLPWHKINSFLRISQRPNWGLMENIIPLPLVETESYLAESFNGSIKISRGAKRETIKTHLLNGDFMVPTSHGLFPNPCVSECCHCWMMSWLKPATQWRQFIPV